MIKGHRTLGGPSCFCSTLTRCTWRFTMYFTCTFHIHPGFRTKRCRSAVCTYICTLCSLSPPAPLLPCCKDDRLRDGRMCSRVCYCSWRLFRASYSGWLTKTQFCRQAYLPAGLPCTAMRRHNGRSDQIRSDQIHGGSSGAQNRQHLGG